jgi:hypothetical protein
MRACDTSIAHEFASDKSYFGQLCLSRRGNRSPLLHDDESPRYDNEFRVWQIVRGRFHEQSDPFLSPCIPTIEDAYGGE